MARASQPTMEKPVHLPQRLLTKQEFGRRLEQLMLAKGWNQSELARQATKQLPIGSKTDVGRDLISVYIKGKSLPGGVILRAIAAALKIDPGELLPNSIASSADDVAPALEMRQIPNQPGTVFLRINRVVPFQLALEIMQLLKDER